MENSSSALLLNKCHLCDLCLDSAASLEVHLKYHHQNLLNQWASASTPASKTPAMEKNNNTKSSTMPSSASSSSANCEYPTTLVDNLVEVTKQSPEFNSNTPSDGSFAQPSTPHSGSNSSPNMLTNYQPIVKPEKVSPNQQQPQGYFQANLNSQFQQYCALEPQNYWEQIPIEHTTPVIYRNASDDRYHPYNRSRNSKDLNISSTSTTMYSSQSADNLSPKQDNRPYLSRTETYMQPDFYSQNNLVYHSLQQQVSEISPLPHQHHHHHQQQQQVGVKEEGSPQREILDLDSQKLVHPWSNQVSSPKEQKLLLPSMRTLVQMGNWPTIQQPLLNMPCYQNDGYSNQKNYQTTTDFSVVNNENSQQQEPPQQQPPQQQQCQQFDICSHDSTSAFTNVQMKQNANATVTSTTTAPKSWKSNEARRAKTYHCTACNKWFTSSGHLKRHYNTTLHKTAVSASGRDDPATLPLSAHYYPDRNSTTSKDVPAQSKNDIKVEQTVSMPTQYDNRSGHVQQTNGGNYEQQTNPHAASTGLVQQSTAGSYIQVPNINYQNVTNGSSPNGEAGFSITEPRGLLRSTNTIPTYNMMAGQTPILTPMDNHQQYPSMYPNESAPHVTQTTATITTNNIIGDLEISNEPPQQQQLPSFSNIRAGIILDNINANVGGTEPVMAQTEIVYEPTILMDNSNDPDGMVQVNNIDSNYVVRTVRIRQFSPTATNNNHENSTNDNMVEFRRPAPRIRTPRVANRTRGRTTLTRRQEQLNNTESAAKPKTVTVFSGEVPIAEASIAPSGCNFRELALRYQQPRRRRNISSGNGVRPFIPTISSGNIPEDILFLNYYNRDANSIDATIEQDNSGSEHIPSTSTTPSNENSNRSPSPQGAALPVAAAVAIADDSIANRENNDDEKENIPAADIENLLAEQNKIRCDCGHRARKKCSHSQHRNSQHTGEKPFKCSICGKRYPTAEKRDEHITNHDPRNKPYKCPDCVKTYKHNTDLKRHHMTIHGICPHKCPVCDKRFSRRDHLSDHLMTHFKTKPAIRRKNNKKDASGRGAMKEKN